MKRLLVANRGEIARRIIRTAHRMGIATVAVFSDADANALHVREATLSFALGGNASAETYLRIDKLLGAAKATGADAVHPGYGFLSENADFAQAVLDAGLVWVGPPPRAIRTLGSKSSAKALASARGVPCLPGYQGADQSDTRFEAQAQRIGFPVMVKAAAGGGGRGMRLVHQPSQLHGALHGARSEAQAAFGSSELLLERALLAPRHVEVQVLADSLGHCIHLGERDCSVQRRHQKIIEETPSPGVDAVLRERMGRCAVELALAAGYVGAGTVEFLLADGEFFMMEMNTRIQVEHPVTEEVTGLDLVEWQLRIARGEPLALSQEKVTFSGHAIEVRLCAEDEHFTPHSGVVKHFRAPANAACCEPAHAHPGTDSGRRSGYVRFDHAIFEGMQVSPHYDSMLGKLIVHAPTRDEAIRQLAAALDRTEILGLPTNRRLLAACLRHPRFVSGDATVPFLAEHGEALRGKLHQEEAAVSLECGLDLLYPSRDTPLPCPFPRPVRLRHRGRVMDATPTPGVRAKQPVSGVRVHDNTWHLQSGAIDLWLEDASFEPASGGVGVAGANELRAPFNGKVIAITAEPGATVVRGETLLVLESMKLEHVLSASRDGVIKSVHVEPGQQAATAQVLVTFEALQ